MRIKMVKKRYGLEKTIPLMLNDVHIRAEPDTGADVNIMDEYQYRVLQHRSGQEMEFQKTITKLRALQTELSIKGEFDTLLRNQTCGKKTKFLVIRVRINSPPLISKSTLTELGMLQINEAGSFASSNNMCIPENISNVHAVVNNAWQQSIQKIQ